MIEIYCNFIALENAKTILYLQMKECEIGEELQGASICLECIAGYYKLKKMS